MDRRTFLGGFVSGVALTHALRTIKLQTKEFRVVEKEQNGFWREIPLENLRVGDVFRFADLRTVSYRVATDPVFLKGHSGDWHVNAVMV